MKTKLFLFPLFALNLCFGQANLNQSVQPVQTSISTPIPPFGTEIFRFRSGLVTQLDAGSAFDFTSSNWFSLGRLNTGTQTVYGLRFQLPNKAVTFGYQDVNSPNPRIQWIGTGANLGNLEFRVANSFTSTSSTLVATMTREGNTIFGNPSVTGNGAKVSIDNNSETGLLIQSSNGTNGFVVNTNTPTNLNTGGIINTSNASQNEGLIVNTSGGINNTSIRCDTSSGSSALGVLSFATNSSFAAAIYGKSNQFAGFFDGDVFIAGSFGPSDAKLKENIKPETNVLERLSQLNAVTYDFKRISELNLPKGLQHGFIAQDLANVFPELTKDIKKPVFDKEGKIVSHFEFKSVNYEGLIPV